MFSIVGLSRLNLNKCANVRDAKLKADYAHPLGYRDCRNRREVSTWKNHIQLAEQYGCCRRAIVNALKKSSITATKAKAQEVLNPDDVIKMYSEYHTTAEIAKKYGVNPNSVIRCLRSNGVAIRSRWDYPRY